MLYVEKAAEHEARLRALQAARREQLQAAGEADGPFVNPCKATPDPVCGFDLWFTKWRRQLEHDIAGEHRELKTNVGSQDMARVRPLYPEYEYHDDYGAARAYLRVKLVDGRLVPMDEAETAEVWGRVTHRRNNEAAETTVKSLNDLDVHAKLGAFAVLARHDQDGARKDQKFWGGADLVTNVEFRARQIEDGKHQVFVEVHANGQPWSKQMVNGGSEFGRGKADGPLCIWAADGPALWFKAMDPKSLAEKWATLPVPPDIQVRAEEFDVPVAAIRRALSVLETEPWEIEKRPMLQDLLLVPQRGLLVGLSTYQMVVIKFGQPIALVAPVRIPNIMARALARDKGVVAGHKKGHVLAKIARTPTGDGLWIEPAVWAPCLSAEGWPNWKALIPETPNHIVVGPALKAFCKTTKYPHLEISGGPEQIVLRAWSGSKWASHDGEVGDRMVIDGPHKDLELYSERITVSTLVLSNALADAPDDTAIQYGGGSLLLVIQYVAPYGEVTHVLGRREAVDCTVTKWRDLPASMGI